MWHAGSDGDAWAKPYEGGAQHDDPAPRPPPLHLQAVRHGPASALPAAERAGRAAQGAASQRSAMAGVPSLRLDWRLFGTVSEIETHLVLLPVS
jgi:hypothetical protein